MSEKRRVIIGVAIGMLTPVLIVAGLIMWVMASCDMLPWQKAKMERWHEAYLEKKYQEDFKVERLEYYANEGGESGFRFKVTLVRRPEVTWVMNNIVYDGYLDTLWSKDATEDLRPTIERLFGKVDYEVSIVVNDDSYKSLKGKKIPSYREARKLYPEEFKRDGFSHVIGITQFKELTNENKQEDYKKFFEIITEAKKEVSKGLIFDATYYEPEFENYARKIINEKGLHYFENIYFAHLRYQSDFKGKQKHWIRIMSDEIGEINSPDDIDKFLDRSFIIKK